MKNEVGANVHVKNCLETIDIKLEKITKKWAIRTTEMEKMFSDEKNKK